MKQRNLFIAANREEALHVAVDQWLTLAKEAIAKRGAFFVALSGGSTPAVIYRALAQQKDAIDWSSVYLFWSDERAVAPTHPDSNYKMAMESGLDTLPITHIYRMEGELDPKIAAMRYNELIASVVPERTFDLVMLGMGPDGHTASLFPGTTALAVTGVDATDNFLPDKGIFRLTLTFDCINRARHIAIYVLGSDKADALQRILDKGADLPAGRIGDQALWVLDNYSPAN